MKINKKMEFDSRKQFLKTKVNKLLILAGSILGIVYFIFMITFFKISNPIIYGLLIFGGVFHLFQFLTYLYTIWDTEYMPSIRNKNFSKPVDVFITVAGEPLEIVEETLVAAKNMNYPNFKVYILNDGLVAKKDNWEEIETLAKKYDVRCITRTIPGGAKAGNINHALAITQSPYVAIFDADHVPYTTFLNKTMSYFEDSKVAYVQTPQYYKNFETNIVTRSAWEQQQLFFGPICKGKNRDNASTMCGTNMVLSRSILEEIGGMWEKSIAEDLLTGILMHEKGYKSVYVPEVLAEGLAPEDFLSYFNQQFRWARGALDLIFRQNILFRNIFKKKGLSIVQRLQYFSSVSFFLSGIIVLIHAIIPVIFFFTGAVPIESSTMVLATVFLPYIFLNLFILERSSNFTFTFASLAFSNAGFNIHIKALYAALTGQKSKFQITPKQAVKGNFINLVTPHIIYIIVVVIGIIFAFFREGLSASLVTNSAWAILNIGIFIPFIYAALPNKNINSSIANNKTKNREWRTLSVILILTSFVSFAILIATKFFQNLSLRLDEAQSLWQTAHTPLKILNIIGQDVHVPLYHFILYAWQYFVGYSVITGRTLSLLFFLGSIILIYLLGKLSYNKSVGLFASLLLTISPFMNWYASEIRMYTMFVFFVLASQYLFISLWKNPSLKIWIGYIFIGIFGIYTHYFFGLFLICHVIFFFLHMELFPKKYFRKFLLSGSIIGITFLPWFIYSKLLGSGLNTSPGIIAPSTVDLFNTLSQFLFGFQTPSINTLLVSLWPISVLVVFLFLHKSKKEFPESTFFVISFMLPISIAFLISVTFRPIFLSRYLIFAMPSLLILISWIFYSYRSIVSTFAKIGLVLLMILTLGIQILNTYTPVKEDYRAASAYIQNKEKLGDVIVITAPFTIYPFMYYFKGSSSIRTLPLWNRSLPGGIPPFREEVLPKEVNKILEGHNNLWLLTSYDNGYQDKIVQYFYNNYELLNKKDISADISLYQFKIRY